MTLLVSWIGVDDKKDGKSVASLYIASDSRYSWGNGDVYNNGIKVFGSNRYPEIFGFCGDVQFCTIVLPQLISEIDSGILLQSGDDIATKNYKIKTYIENSLNNYPKQQIVRSFNILHATRVIKEFSCYQILYTPGNGVNCEIVELPRISTKIFGCGTGNSEFDSNWSKWTSKSHNNYRTSRAVYHCLVYTLKNIRDKASGGLPQIVGLYRQGNAKIFGIIDSEKAYIYGREVSPRTNLVNIEWRNENFERVNPQTLKLFDGAQRQPS